MYRIASFGRAVAKPARPTDVSTPGYFQAATQVDYGWLNTIQEEHAQAVLLSGLTLDPDDDTQLHQAITRFGGRTWWRSCCWLEYEAEGSNTNLAVVRFLSAGYVAYGVTGATPNNSANGHALVIPLDIRGLRVEAAQITYETMTAFDGADVLRSIDLYHIGADGVSTLIGGTTLNLTATPGDPQTIALTMTDDPTPSAGGSLVALLKISRTGASVGAVNVYNFAVQFEEGHE